MAVIAPERIKGIIPIVWRIRTIVRIISFGKPKLKIYAGIFR
jgi:hypothetical protein